MSILSKQSQMISMVELWKQSGKTKKDFAEENGLSYHSLKYWIFKLYHQDRIRTSEHRNQDFSFIELNQEEFKPESSRTPQIELTLPNGIQLKIY